MFVRRITLIADPLLPHLRHSYVITLRALCDQKIYMSG